MKDEKLVEMYFNGFFSTGVISLVLMLVHTILCVLVCFVMVAVVPKPQLVFGTIVPLIIVSYLYSYLRNNNKNVLLSVLVAGVVWLFSIFLLNYVLPVNGVVSHDFVISGFGLMIFTLKFSNRIYKKAQGFCQNKINNLILKPFVVQLTKKLNLPEKDTSLIIEEISSFGKRWFYPNYKKQIIKILVDLASDTKEKLEYAKENEKIERNQSLQITKPFADLVGMLRLSGFEIPKKPLSYYAKKGR